MLWADDIHVSKSWSKLPSKDTRQDGNYMAELKKKKKKKWIDVHCNEIEISLHMCKNPQFH